MANTDFEDFDIEEFLIKAPLYEQLMEEYLNAIRKRVICIENGIIYDSIKNAEELTGFNHSNISRCCHGIRSNCGGLHFYFIDDDNNVLYMQWESKRKRKKIIRLEGLIIYNNLQEASNLTGICESSIQYCCNGYRSHAYGYHFEYYDENKVYKDLSSNYKKPDQGAIKVQCIETNQIFNSMREASRQTGATHEGIRLCCNGKGKTSGNLHWKFYTE